MPKRPVVTSLQANTNDIVNTIRANASPEYRDRIPVVTNVHDLRQVGEYFMGYPVFANEFISSLINRVAFVDIKSATFNNAYAKYKKGYLEFGETIEEVFVELAKAREFSAEKAEAREFKRTLPDVRTAFHVMNWKVQYPITIQNEDLRMAFLSYSGVEDLIARIVGSITAANEYDEFLLFKYLLIKGVNKGEIKVQNVTVTDPKDMAVAFRATSNLMEFIQTKYNKEGVHTSTKRSEQEIIMDANFNAEFDVNVLASAFNMGKADFMGKLQLMDDFTSFDNDRFSIIRENSNMIEEVTAAELAAMADIKAILIDPEWFQVYDMLASMSEKYVASGLYWNYFYNTWKVLSSSPFSNAVAFKAVTE